MKNVKKGDTIVISYVGYQAKEISWTGGALNVVLKEDTEILDEVVVIGYGVVRKADMAGSVAVLDNKNFKDQPITQVADALQGRVSGVHVENSGVPGGSVKIRVRGANSISKSNDPCMWSMELSGKVVWMVSILRISVPCRFSRMLHLRPYMVPEVRTGLF